MRKNKRNNKRKNKRKFFAMLLALAMILSFAACSGIEEPVVEEGPAAEKSPAEIQGKIILATTTSTKDSGLLDFILPEFTYHSGWEVDVISVGSGEAMAMGEAGEADVLLVHSPKDEAAFVDNGHADGDGRFDVMYTDFVLIGPKTDPSEILKMTTSDEIAVFTKIFNDQSTFISRSDASGTHKNELSIWAKAALTPEGDWYVEAASGMGAVITMADEKSAYTLTDRATWLSIGSNTDLQIVFEKVPSGTLNDQYTVICVNPKKNEIINEVGAKDFRNWILSADTQKLIGTYGVEKFGAPLFTPNAK